ncbi:MAG: T9SS type A sorting domain-containing protein [Bacteroidia bacterium]|nr:T9SS type A sorting domain-containing protein [Bacteroidia bacterium]
MKKLLPVILILISSGAFTQPVMLNGNNLPAAGNSFNVTVASLSPAGVGSAGANQIWDFSSLTFSQAGTIDVISPAASPIGSSFPTANYCMAFSGTYSFFKTSATDMEVQAWRITQPGFGSDYTPDPRTLLIFPFNFNDSVTDSYQKVGGVQNTVTITYDGYGTLITPTATYNDVVRIRADYGNGLVDYQWCTLAPLFWVAVFDHDSNTLTYVDIMSSGVSSQELNDFSFDVNTDPSGNALTIPKIPTGSNLRFTDINGKILCDMVTSHESARLDISGFANGLYSIQVVNKGRVENRKIIINR